MKLSCHLLGHRVASHAVHNQGFQFSRCRRCRCDMIRSIAPASSRWIPVPGDLRIAWNGVDANALVGLSRYALAWCRARAMLSGALDVLRIGVPLTVASIAEKLQRPCHNSRAVGSPLRLTLFAHGIREPKQWRIAAGMNLQRKRVHFECIFGSDRRVSVFC